MVVWRNLILLFICSTLLWNARAEEGNLELDLVKHIKFELKFHDLILKMSNEIDRDFENIPVEELEQRHMDEYLRNKMGQFVELYKNHSEFPKNKIEHLKQVMTKEIKWSEVWKSFKRLNVGIETFFKRNGFGVSLAILLGYVSDWVVLVVAGQLGLKTIMAVSPFTPYAMLYALAPKYTHHLRMRNRLIKVLGGKTEYLAYREQMRLTAKELKLGNPYRMFFPSTNYIYPVKSTGDVVESVVIPRSAPMAGLAQKLGIDIKSLNYNSLIVFMTAHNIKNDYIDDIKRNPKISRWQKVAAIVDNIINTQEESVILAFKNRFHDSFIKVKSTPYWNQLKGWVRNVKNIKDVNELKKYVTRVPEWVEAREIMTFWEELILPELSKHRNISYSQYRKLVRETELLKASAISSKEKWTPSFQQKFLKLIGKSLAKPDFSDCRNSSETVLYHLVRKAVNL